MPRTPLCDRCKLPHPPIIECLHALQRTVKEFLLRTSNLGTCSGCRATVYWTVHLNGKRAPYDENGLNHFVSCPQAEKFSGGAA